MIDAADWQLASCHRLTFMGLRDLRGLLERGRRELCPAARHFPKRAARSTWLLAYSPDGPRVNWFELLFAMAEPLLQLVPLDLAAGAAREFISTNEANRLVASQPWLDTRISDFLFIPRVSSFRTRNWLP